MNELKLLKGEPIEVIDDLKVYPLKLSEIADIGEEVYNQYLSSVMIDHSVLEKSNENMIEKDKINELYKLNELEFIIFLSNLQPVILSTFIQALSIFLRSRVEFNDETGFVIKNNEIECSMSVELFRDIKNIIVKQNFLKDKDYTNYNPANEKARRLLQKLKKVREKIQAQNKDEGLSLREIISIVATYSNDLNIISVWDLTVNQLYESYLRILLWDDYQKKIILLPHVTDSESLDMKHWAVDINKIQNN